MSRSSLLACIFAVLVIPALAHAGEEIAFKLDQPPALPKARVRSVVAEFLDSDSTSLGAAVASVIGGELLDAISDLSGNAVLVATDHDHTGIVAKLGDGYHRAALTLARNQKAMLAVWGSIEDDGADLTLMSFVTQVPDDSLGALRYQLRFQGTPVEGFDTEISSRSFHFAPRVVARRSLFRRKLVILNQSRALFVLPDAGSARLATLTPGMSLDADTLAGGWWHVRAPGGERGWIRNHSNIVRIPPRFVDVESGSVKTYAEPKATAPSRMDELGGTYAVLETRYTSKGKWYRIAPGPGPAHGGPVLAVVSRWIPASSATARYTLPLVHFVAGIHRFRLARYPEARKDFAACIRQAEGEDNVTLSAAYQLMGLSSLDLFPSGGDPLRPFSSAVRLTPFDSRAYSVRALASVATRKAIDDSVLHDLGRALQFNPGDRTARRMVAGMKQMLSVPTPGGLHHSTLGTSLEGRRETVTRLHVLASDSTAAMGWKR